MVRLDAQKKINLASRMAVCGITGLAAIIDTELGHNYIPIDATLTWLSGSAAVASVATYYDEPSLLRAAKISSYAAFLATAGVAFYVISVLAQRID